MPLGQTCSPNLSPFFAGLVLGLGLEQKGLVLVLGLRTAGLGRGLDCCWQ